MKPREMVLEQIAHRGEFNVFVGRQGIHNSSGTASATADQADPQRFVPAGSGNDRRKRGLGN